jgi:glycosyltransferase involved in cell wall biosynthesis
VWVARLRERGVPYVVGNVARFNAVANFLLFWRVLRRERIDAVYTHFGFERFWATFFGKLLGRTVIWNEHWHSLGTRYTAIKRLFYRLFVDEFIAVSRYIADTLPRGAVVHAIPNAIGPATDAPADKETVRRLRTALALPLDAKIVLMVAEFRADKRPLLALEICGRVAAQAAQHVVFVFLGDGQLRAQFLQQVERMGLSDRVISPGHVNNVDDYYRCADVSILTSEYEPFGYCVLEAMRHTLPVVSFDTGGPSEIIRNGETGLLVPEGNAGAFSDAVLELLIDEPRRRRLGNEAKVAVAERFSRQVWIAAVLNVLKGHSPSAAGTEREQFAALRKY